MSTVIDIQRTQSPRQRPDVADLGFGRFFTDHMFLMDFEPERGWHGARVVPYGPIPMDPAAAALHYGQTIFEGLKAFPSPGGKINVFRLDAHLARLNESAKKLCIPPLDPHVVGVGIRTLLGVDADWMPAAEGTSLYIRPLVFATEGFLGVRPATRYTICIFLSPVAGYYAAGAKPVRIWIEETATRAAPGGLGAAKTGANYAASMKAGVEAKARGYAQVLWLDATEHRYVEEVGTMNLFVRIGDEVITPPLKGGTLLAGVTRDCVLTLLRDLGIKVTERRIAMDEIRGAHAAGTLNEVFGTGTAAVISPVGELGSEKGALQIGGGEAGSVATRLRQAISDIQYGRVADRYGWLSACEVLAPAA